MPSRRYNATTAGLAAGAAIAAMLLASPDADADTDVVYIGGTGTGLPIVGTPNGTSYANTFAPGHDQLVNLNYDGSPIANPQAAAPAALAAIRSTDDPTVVIGVSKGAQVAHGAEAKDTRTDTTYVYVGDPDGANGISRQLGISPKPVTPTHNTITVNAEYDGVGDMPDRFNPLATVNAIAGWAFIHTQYGNGTAADPLTRLGNGRTTVKRNPNGTTSTTTLIPTKHLPLLKPLRDTELTLTHQSRGTDALEAAIRPVIDSGYSRNDKPKTTAGTPKTGTSESASGSHNATSSTAEGSE